MNSSMIKVTGMIIVIAVLLSACGLNGSFPGLLRPGKGTQADDAITPKMRADQQEKPQNLGHITVAAAAAVSETELQQAVAKPVARPERDLGTTIASLGLLGQDGFWLETPLVESKVEGRVTYLENGTSINLRLIPSGAVAGSGSRISVAAMQILGIPIVDLAELRVFIR